MERIRADTEIGVPRGEDKHDDFGEHGIIGVNWFRRTFLLLIPFLLSMIIHIRALCNIYTHNYYDNESQSSHRMTD